MAKAMAAWGIDIGQCAMKAIKLVDYGDEIEVEDFAVIEHPEILSQPDVDRPGLIRQALEGFLSAHDTKGSLIVLSVPGQSSFTRFFKPPPVEPKELPRIVQYEAAQQIPFAIDEVVWQWQAFQDPDSPDLEVGIFAMKRLDIAEMLGHLTDIGIYADIVQVAPLALYNFASFDGQAADEGATLLVDIGADKTDLVVSDGAHIWNRTVQIGGNNFTEALARAFKLSFAKAEKLKRTAATSKYARQVFQAMRPVFEDLVQEMQRSTGYYKSLHRESNFKKLLGLGNGFRLPGLQKFLEQNLNIPVTRLDGFKSLHLGGTVNVPHFQENSLSFGVAYGLAAQALRPVPVTTSLLPAEIARRRLWQRKVPWFATAAVLLLLAMACPVLRAFWDSQALPAMKDNPTVLSDPQGVVRQLDALRREYDKVISDGRQEEAQIRQYLSMFGYRSFWPSLEALVAKSFREVTDAADRQLLEMKLQSFLDAPAEVRPVLIEEFLGAASPGASQDVQALLVRFAQAEEGDRPSIIAELAERVHLPESRNVQRLIRMMVDATDIDLRKQILADIEAIPRNQRRVFFVEQIASIYSADLHQMIPAADRPARAGRLTRGFQVVVRGRTPLSLPDALEALDRLKKAITPQMDERLPSLAVVHCSHSAAPGQPPPQDPTAGLTQPDSLFPNEDAAGDTKFVVTWLVAIVDDGLDLDAPGGANP
jgi:type IV pilus assembly protein PilM